MEVLNNFKNLFVDVWTKGISGINISEIIIAVSIFIFFLLLRGFFQNLLLNVWKNMYLKHQISLIIHWFHPWKAQLNFFQ